MSPSIGYLDKSDSQEAQALFNDVWPVAELISHEYVRLNTVKFKLPSRYGFVIDEKIK
jgi:hypothetical protein